MKLSCLPVSFFQTIIEKKMSLFEWVSTAKKLGLDAVDISILLVPDRTPRCISEVKKQLLDGGLGITMITTYPDFTNPNKIQRERELDYFIADIAVSAELGAKYLRVTAGQLYEIADPEQTADIAAEYILRSKLRADEYGIELLFENHARPGVWDRVDFTYYADNFLLLLDKLKDSGIRVNFDTANIWSSGDDAVGLFKRILPHVETIHVSDMNAPLSFCVIGEGKAPIREILSLAKASGWDGWLCIEEASRTGIDGVEKAIKFVKYAWE